MKSESTIMLLPFLNLGCGARYFNDWHNVDFTSSSASVIAADLSGGVPFVDSSFEVVYHSHVLEHFSQDRALSFVRECHRVLRNGGVLRVVVPDLEPIAQNYLKMLERVRIENNDLNRANYDWSVIEMFDQTVRAESGGEMARFWSNPAMVNEDWIVGRMGDEFKKVRAYLLKHGLPSPVHPNESHGTWSQRLKHRLIVRLTGEPRYPEFLQYARFRFGGEIHQWMYDSYSLGRLMKNAGFNDIRVVDAFESSIPDWERHKWLDVENGVVRKPDSLFMEAVK